MTEKSKLSKAKQVYVYRIVQEAINNTLKHAQCSEIQLSITEFDDQLNVFIKDNGKGFDVNDLASHSGHGIKNIKERSALLNGEAVIESDNNGTTIDINIPLE